MMKTSIRSIKMIGALLAATFALAAGCDANHVLGTHESGAAGTGSNAGAGGDAGTFQGAQAGSTGGTSSVAGATGGIGGSTGAGGLKAGPLGPSQSWTGYIEQRTFLSGSGQIKLTFAEDASGIVAGTVVFGMGTPPPPATNPDVGYPEGTGKGLAAAMGGPLMSIAEGYAYTFDGGTLDSASHRLRFTVQLAQLWAGWCALQTPPVDGSESCVPTWDHYQDTQFGCHFKDPKTGTYSLRYDCDKVDLCSILDVCHCDAAGCGMNTNGTLTVYFDVFISGDTMSGSAWDFNIHFVRD